MFRQALPFILGAVGGVGVERFAGRGRHVIDRIESLDTFGHRLGTSKEYSFKFDACTHC